MSHVNALAGPIHLDLIKEVVYATDSQPLVVCVVNAKRPWK